MHFQVCQSIIRCLPWIYSFRVFVSRFRYDAKCFGKFPLPPAINIWKIFQPPNYSIPPSISDQRVCVKVRSGIGFIEDLLMAFISDRIRRKCYVWIIKQLYFKHTIHILTIKLNTSTFLGTKCTSINGAYTKIPSPWTSKPPRHCERNTVNGDLHRRKILSYFNKEITVIEKGFWRLITHYVLLKV